MDILTTHSRRTLQRGFSLIEVLVATLILAIGLLGMAALQLNAKRVSYDAVQRSQASALILDMLERMRSNQGQLDAYVTVGDGLGGATIGGEPVPVCSAADPCDAAQLAAHDLWEWEQAIDGAAETRVNTSGTNLNVGGLVNPTACISNIGGEITIAIAWLGAVPLSNPGANACGEGLGRYGSNDDKRQLLSIVTYIEASI